MKYFVQFLVESSGKKFQDGKMVDVAKFPVNALGSDGVFILDGRNNLNTMIVDAKQRKEQLKNVKTFVGFKIMQGERFTDCKEIYNSINN